MRIRIRPTILPASTTRRPAARATRIRCAADESHGAGRADDDPPGAAFLNQLWRGRMRTAIALTIRACGTPTPTIAPVELPRGRYGRLDGPGLPHRSNRG